MLKRHFRNYGGGATLEYLTRIRACRLTKHRTMNTHVAARTLDLCHDSRTSPPGSLLYKAAQTKQKQKHPAIANGLEGGLWR